MKSNHQFYIRTIPQSIEEDNKQGWRFKNLFSVSTRIMEKYQTTFIVIDKNTTLHPVHQHSEEELVFIISGSLDLISNNDELPNGQNIYQLLPGTLIYLPAYDPHTFRAAGPGQTKVVGVRWKGVPGESFEGLLRRCVFNIYSKPSVCKHDRPGFSRVPLFNDPTRYTTNLRAHHIHIETGSGYGRRTHTYDLMMILLAGRLDTMHMQISSPALLLFPAGITHWARNTDLIPASLLTLEFSKRIA